MEPTPEGVKAWLDERLSAAGLPPVRMVRIDPPEDEPATEPAALSDPELIAKLVTTSPALWNVARQHGHALGTAGCECMGVAALHEFRRCGWLSAEGLAILNVFDSWPG
jgi:hypothetical protein